MSENEDTHIRVKQTVRGRMLKHMKAHESFNNFIIRLLDHYEGKEAE